MFFTNIFLQNIIEQYHKFFDPSEKQTYQFLYQIQEQSLYFLFLRLGYLIQAY